MDYYRDAMQAFSGKAHDEGIDVLSNIFGSKDVSRAVAAHVQSLTGIGEAVLKQMMPYFAAMLMGGIGQQTREANPMQQMMDMMGGQSAAFTDMMEAFTKAMQPQKEEPKEEPAAADPMAGMMDAFGKMFEAGVDVQRSNAEALGRIFENATKKD